MPIDVHAHYVPPQLIAAIKSKGSAIGVRFAPADGGKEAFARIKCPVYGFYGGNDSRINATIPKTKEQMKAAGKTYEPVTYEGAGHGFMRVGDQPNAAGANKKAHDEAWERWLKVLKGI